ncbi:hypothetical protein RchiOBHm_Chr6g0264951 [Rosa chinensis]|uniref:Uncharacterized protein n=1 Tax=Rosa chinensis TaxID=74649 RepID=A0A2P6PPD2_ROSCH|nr:hypothetical protein RchiOBHm_Chr6g0264951 [Rosa chinensis]
MQSKAPRMCLRQGFPIPNSDSVGLNVCHLRLNLRRRTVVARFGEQGLID